MPRPYVHPTILAAKGVEFPLPGFDTPPRLCYSFAALMVLEEQFGSIQAVLDVMEEGEKGKAFGGIVRILAAGFVHEPPLEDGAALDQPKVLASFLDPADLESYSSLLADAFGRAFPEPVKGAAPSDPPVAPSPGGTGTTPPPFTFAGQTPSSGE